MQRKPLTAEVLNFTKRLGEKVLTIYHRKSLFKDKSSNTILDSSISSSFEWRTLRWRQIYKDEYCLYCCRWPTFPQKENDSRSEENISKRMSVQFAILKILKLKLGSEAWGNKTKEITSRLRDEWYISFVRRDSKPYSQILVGHNRLKYVASEVHFRGFFFRV